MKLFLYRTNLGTVNTLLGGGLNLRPHLLSTEPANQVQPLPALHSNSS